MSTTSSTSSAAPPSSVSWRFSAIARARTSSREPRRVEHVSGADTDTSGLVGVGRPDALERGADLVVAAQRLGDGVVGLVPGEDEVRPAGDAEPVARDAARRQRVDLGEQRRQVDDDAVGDDRDDVVVEDPARRQLQGVALAADDDGVAGVVPALVAHDVAVLLGQQVDDLGLAFVAPLSPDDDGDRHGRATLAVAASLHGRVAAVHGRSEPPVP